MFPTAWTVALCLWPVLSFAGGLGFAPLVGLVALTAFAARPRIDWRIHGALLGAGFVWALISYAWSPWDGQILEFDPGNGKYAVKSSPLRLALVAVSATFVIAMARQMDQRKLAQLFKWSMCSIGVMIGVIVALALFERGLIDLVAPLSSERAETVQNVGRNAVLTVVSTPVLLAYLASTVKHGAVFAGMVAIAVCASCLALGFYAAALSIVGGALAAGLVWVLPRRGFELLGYACAAWIIVSPFVMLSVLNVRNGVEGAASADVASAMWRMDMWRIAADMIVEKPLMGWGADAARTINIAYVDGPFEGELILSGHPHNMPLHIWLETGAVGAFIVAATLVALGRSLPAPSQLPSATASAAAGVWGACAVVCCVSFSVWNAGWWGFVALMTATLVIDHRRRSEASA